MTPHTPAEPGEPKNPVAPASYKQAGDGHEVSEFEVADSSIQENADLKADAPRNLVGESSIPAEPSDINVTKAKPQVTKALHKPCPKCFGVGYLFGNTNNKCSQCHGTGTVEQQRYTDSSGATENEDSDIPGPPTSSESPQTLGVTAGSQIGTDEGGPGTIEAGQGFEDELKDALTRNPKYTAQTYTQILAAHEAAKAQAVIAAGCPNKWCGVCHAASQLRATGTGEGTNTN